MAKIQRRLEAARQSHEAGLLEAKKAARHEVVGSSYAMDALGREDLAKVALQEFERRRKEVSKFLHDVSTMRREPAGDLESMRLSPVGWRFPKEEFSPRLTRYWGPRAADVQPRPATSGHGAPSSRGSRRGQRGDGSGPRPAPPRPPGTAEGGRADRAQDEAAAGARGAGASPPEAREEAAWGLSGRAQGPAAPAAGPRGRVRVPVVAQGASPEPAPRSPSEACPATSALPSPAPEAQPEEPPDEPQEQPEEGPEERALVPPDSPAPPDTGEEGWAGAGAAPYVPELGPEALPELGGLSLADYFRYFSASVPRERHERELEERVHAATKVFQGELRRHYEALKRRLGEAERRHGAEMRALDAEFRSQVEALQERHRGLKRQLAVAQRLARENARLRARLPQLGEEMRRRIGELDAAAAAQEARRSELEAFCQSVPPPREQLAELEEEAGAAEEELWHVQRALDERKAALLSFYLEVQGVKHAQQAKRYAEARQRRAAERLAYYRALREMADKRARLLAAARPRHEYLAEHVRLLAACRDTAAALDSALRLALSCPACGSVLLKARLLQPCGHTFCKSCTTPFRLSGRRGGRSGARVARGHGEQAPLVALPRAGAQAGPPVAAGSGVRLSACPTCKDEGVSVEAIPSPAMDSICARYVVKESDAQLNTSQLSRLLERIAGTWRSSRRPSASCRARPAAGAGGGALRAGGAAGMAEVAIPADVLEELHAEEAARAAAEAARAAAAAAGGAGLVRRRSSADRHPGPGGRRKSGHANANPNSPSRRGSSLAPAPSAGAPPASPRPA
eukprot:tig00001030_g6481.t1